MKALLFLTAAALLARPAIDGEGRVVAVRFEDGGGRLVQILPEPAESAFTDARLDLRDPSFTEAGHILAVDRGVEGDRLLRLPPPGVDAAPELLFTSRAGARLGDPVMRDGLIAFGERVEPRRRGESIRSRMLLLGPSGTRVADEGGGDRHDPVFLDDGRLLFLVTEGSYVRLLRWMPGSEAPARELGRLEGRMGRMVPLDPVGRTLVIARDTGAGPRLEVWDPDGGGVRALAQAPHSAMDPLRHTDGSSLLVIVPDATGTRVERVPLEGTGPRALR